MRNARILSKAGSDFFEARALGGGGGGGGGGAHEQGRRKKMGDCAEEGWWGRGRQKRSEGMTDMTGRTNHDRT